MPKLIYLLLLSIFSTISVYGQDPVFSQLYANGNYINPALNGIEGEIRLSANYRNQWLGSSANFTTYSTSIEIPFQDNKNSLGIQLINDQAGDRILNTTSINLIYNYNLQINSVWQLRSGFQIGLGQRAFNTEGLVFEDQLEARGGQVGSSLENLGNEQRLYPDISTGFALFSKYGFVGFAAHHINRPNVSFDLDRKFYIDPKYTLHGGIKIQNSKSRHSYISPSFIVQKQGESTSISLGNYIKHRQISGGVWYRFNQAVVILIGIELKQFRMGYSTDLWLTKLNRHGSTHEISMSILIPQNASKRKKRKELLFCPTF